MVANAPDGAWYVLTRTRLGDGPAATLTRFESTGARTWTRVIGEAADEYESPVGVSIIEAEPIVATTRHHGYSRSLTVRRYRADGSLLWRRDPDFGASSDSPVLAQGASATEFIVAVLTNRDAGGQRVHLLRFDPSGNLLAIGAAPEPTYLAFDAAIAVRGGRAIVLTHEAIDSGAEHCAAFEIDGAGKLLWSWRLDGAPGTSARCTNVSVAADGAAWITGGVDGRPRAVRLNANGSVAWTLSDTGAPNPSRWHELAFLDSGDAIVASRDFAATLTRIGADGAVVWRRAVPGCTRLSDLALDDSGRIVSACASVATGRGLLSRLDAAGAILDSTPILDLAPDVLRIDPLGSIGIAGLQAPSTEAQRVAVARYAIDADLLFADGHE
jgi:outer membrane protein assembly factor BamB